MTNDTTRDTYEAWLDEPHPLDKMLTRRDYMPKHDGGFNFLAWQAATLAERERCTLVCEKVDSEQMAKVKQTGQNYYEDYAIGAELCAAAIQPEPFQPDYDTGAVLVEEMQRMAKQLAEMQDWEAVATDQAMTIAMMRVEQEPVAWHTEDHLTDRSATTYSKDMVYRWECKGWPVVPLYTSPQRQPLTKEQILELNTFQYMGITCVHAQVDDGLVDLARAIEAAHGIGKKT